MISPPVTVRARDLNGNLASGAAVTVGIFASSRSLQGTTTQLTDVSGIATFADLKVDTVGSYSLQATAVAGPTVASTPFSVTAASVQNVTVFGGDGQSSRVGTPFATPLQAKAVDASGNAVPGVSVTFAAPAGGPSATFGGPTTVATGSDGVATSPALTSNAVIGAFQVTATAAGAPSATFNLRNLPGAASFLTFVQQPPSSIVAGSTIPPVTVQAKDQFQNPASGAYVTMLLTGPDTTLRGTITRFATADGLVTFDDLTTANLAGINYRLEAISNSISAFSTSFSITAGSPADVFIHRGDTQSATILTPYAIPLAVTVEDSFFNPVSGAPVVFTAPGSGASGLFSGSTTVSVATDAQGHAAAPITANSIAGTFPVIATGAGGAQFVHFQLTNTVGPPGRILFVQQPPATVKAGATISPPVKVRLEDGTGTPISNIPVTLETISTEQPILPLTSTTDLNGEATFAALSISVAGTYQLAATAGAISALSDTIQVTAASPASISVYFGNGQTTVVTTTFAVPLQAKVMDSFGNPVSGASVTFTAPASGPGVTGLPATVTSGAGGIAISPILTANTVVGTFQVTATGAGSAAFTLTNAPGPGRLAFIQQPSNSTAGAPMPDIKVRIQDSFNNALNIANVPVALHLGAPESGGLAIPVQNTDATGTATFKNYSVSGAGSYTLLALSTDYPSAKSAPFNITAGPAANIAAIGGTPQSTLVGRAFVLPLVALVKDALQNPVSNTTVVFNIAASGGAGGTFGGAPTASATTDAQGEASAPILTANALPGTFTVNATIGATTATWTLTNVTTAGTSTITASGGTPQNAAVLSAFALPLQVSVLDAAGNPASGISVTFAAPASGPSATLSPLTATTDSAGHASVNATANNAAGAYAVTATASGVTGSATFSLTNVTSATNLLAFTQQPSNTTAGGTIAPVTLRLTGAGGTPVAGTAVTLSLANSKVPLMGTLTGTTDANGQAVFSNLSVRTTGAYQLAASAGTASGLSNSFEITPASASSITASSGMGQEAAPSTRYALPLKAAVQDMFGNRVSGVLVTFVAPPSGASVVFSGSAAVTTDTTGIATSPPMTANSQTGSFVVNATMTGAWACGISINE